MRVFTQVMYFPVSAAVSIVFYIRHSKGLYFYFIFKPMHNVAVQFTLSPNARLTPDVFCGVGSVGYSIQSTTNWLKFAMQAINNPIYSYMGFSSYYTAIRPGQSDTHLSDIETTPAIRPTNRDRGREV